jgi:hypothetical protein
VLLTVRVAQDANILDPVRYLRGVSANKINKDRLVLFLASYFLNILRDSSTKNHRLSVGHRELKRLNVILKAHVQHLVTLIQNLVFAFLKIKTLVLAKIN